MIKVGDYIGGIFKKLDSNGNESYYLNESKVKRIVSTARGTKIYTDAFYPLDLEDIEANTLDMQEAQGYIITREVFLLTEQIRAHCEAWIQWANAHPGNVQVYF